MKKKANTDHVRLDTRTSSMRCEHCGAEEKLEIPVSVTAFTKRVNVFIRKHAKCPIPPWPLAEEVDARRMHQLLGPGNALRRRYELLHDGNILDTEGIDPEIIARWKRDRPEFFSGAAGATRMGLELRALEAAASGRVTSEEFAAMAEGRAIARSGKTALALRSKLDGLKPHAEIVDELHEPKPFPKYKAGERSNLSLNLKGPAMPRANPCGSCPYRCDVPSGIWDPSEYSKLPAYDAETFAQPIAPFFCHTQDGTVCAGWLGTHGADQLLAVRLGVSSGRLDPSCLDASTDVRLFGSGTEAAAHGLKKVKRPDRKARETIRKLTRAQAIKAARHVCRTRSGDEQVTCDDPACPHKPRPPRAR